MFTAALAGLERRAVGVVARIRKGRTSSRKAPAVDVFCANAHLALTASSVVMTIKSIGRPASTAANFGHRVCRDASARRVLVAPGGCLRGLPCIKLTR